MRQACALVVRTAGSVKAGAGGREGYVLVADSAASLYRIARSGGSVFSEGGEVIKSHMEGFIDT